MFEGFANRLKSELSTVAPHFAEDFNVMASDDRKYAVWKGASNQAKLSTFDSMWITKE